jgi:hypothetical protein
MTNRFRITAATLSALVLTLAALGAPVEPLSASAVMAQTNASSLSNGLVGYWTLDGNQTNWATGQTYDASGQGNTGQLIKMSTSTSPVIGKIGGAINISSNTQYIQTGAATISAPCSVAAWVYLNAHVAAGTGGVLTGGPTSFFSTRPDQNITGADRVGESNNVNDDTFTNPVYVIPLKTWTHLVFVNDSSVATLYVNGVRQGTIARNYGCPAYYIGQDAAAPTTDHFRGMVDDLRIYNRPLSAQEVAHLYALGAAKMAQANTATLQSGLVGYWTLDGNQTNWTANTTQDSSGSGNTGTLVSMNPTTSPTIGKIGQGLMFVASSSQSISYNVVLANLMTVSDGTMSAWVYPTGRPISGSCTSNAVVIDDQNIDVGINRGLISGNDSFCFVGYDGGNRAVSTTITPNHWYLVTWVHTGGVLTGYVNGASIGHVSLGNISWTGGSKLQIGVHGAVTNTFFNGTIDDVRIYNRALSAQEVAQLYALGAAKMAQANTATLASGLVGYWSMDGGSINWNTKTISDLSGQGNTGTFENISTNSPVVGIIGQALQLNASNSSDILIGSTTPLALSVESISAWVKTTTSAEQVVWSSGAAIGYFLEFTAAGTFRWADASGSNNGLSTSFATTASYKDGKWHHVVGSADGTNLKIYVDGTLATTTPGTIIVPTGAKRIGSSQSRYFNGAIDDVRIYNRALSAQEIQQLYKMGAQ